MAQEEEWSLSLTDALMSEYRHGMSTLATGEMLTGLAKYAIGDWKRARP
ncbi:MAG: hypothetical protein HY801_15000 [Candidatus Lindowbacteria bacterium]|nr:hypothetical protein [Candidatus Lindowbacteria bacterium]